MKAILNEGDNNSTKIVKKSHCLVGWSQKKFNISRTDKYFLKRFVHKVMKPLPLQNEIWMSRIRDYRLSSAHRNPSWLTWTGSYIGDPTFIMDTDDKLLENFHNK